MIRLYLFICLLIYESQNSRKINEALKTEQNKTWKSFFFSFCVLNLPRYSYYHGLSSAFSENYAPYNFSQLYQGAWKHNLLFAPYKGIRKVLLVEWESWALESGMQLKESGTPPTTGNPNASSNTWNPRRGNTVLYPLTWSDLCSLAVDQTVYQHNRQNTTEEDWLPLKIPFQLYFALFRFSYIIYRFSQG